MKKLLALLFLISQVLTFAQEKGMDQKIDEAFGDATGWFVEGIFYSIPFTDSIQVPWVLIVLVLGAVYFTIYFKLINITGFKTSINIVRGKYDEFENEGHVEVSETVMVDEDGDNPDTIRIEGDHHGEVTHFQALTAALSATVGLGNIAGVAVAISIGGPGATFWMILAGIIGMASKFVECTLGVKYREIDEEGKVYGGPMYYLKKGLKDKKMAGLGKVLAVVFAIMCIGGSFGGGNMFQSNQAFAMIENVYTKDANEYTDLTELIGKKVDVVYVANQAEYKVQSDDNIKTNSNQTFTFSNIEGEIVSLYDGEKILTMKASDFVGSATVHPLTGNGWVFGLVMAILVGIVIIGGIKKIAKVTDKIVPFMVVIYVLASLSVLFINYQEIPTAFGEIFSGAFTGLGIAGGFVGVLIQGFRRAAFSNEAGIGSASIAHSAVKTKYAASEGLVALLEPFIDTVLVCTMTALVLIVSNGDGEIMTYGQKVTEGVQVTSKAFASSISWFPIVLTIAVVLFAFSTMISWSYYGYQAWSFLFGRSKAVEYAYKALFCVFVIIGAASQLGSVIDFSDAMIFAMLVPNMIGLFFLAPVVRDELKKFLDKVKEQKSKS